MGCFGVALSNLIRIGRSLAVRRRAAGKLDVALRRAAAPRQPSTMSTVLSDGLVVGKLSLIDTVAVGGAG